MKQHDRDQGPLAGMAVLLTGATGHLGRAMAVGLARDGALPVLNGRKEAKLQALAQELKAQGHACQIICGDVSDEALMSERLPDLAGTLKQDGWQLRGLVNNAFAGSASDAQSDTQSLYAEAARINLGAVAHLITTFAALPSSAPKSIVNIASIYGLVSPDLQLYPEGVAVNPPFYGATKAGLIQLTRYYAVALAGHGVRVNAVTPGAFPSAAMQADNPQFIENLSNRTPMKRIGQPDELYPAIRFLLGNDATFVTGSNVTVDGGWTAI